MVRGGLPEMMLYVRNFLAEEGGQDLVEYSLLIVFFVFTAFAVASGGMPAINAIWGKTGSNLTAASTAAGG